MAHDHKNDKDHCHLDADYTGGVKPIKRSCRGDRIEVLRPFQNAIFAGRGASIDNYGVQHIIFDDSGEEKLGVTKRSLALKTSTQV